VKPRPGTAGRAAAAAESVAAALRRRRRDREPRVVLYDRSGSARRVPPDHPAHATLVSLAVELAGAVDDG
jgi:LmbE family N-acetylglucosaminyl deacetylase